MSTPDPIRAALQRLVKLDDAHEGDRQWEPWLNAIAAARAALEATPPAPAAGEVGELVAWCTMQATYHEAAGTRWARYLSRAAALLEQFSAAQASQPVAVSERLPEPKDCDAEGRCWLGGHQMDGGTPTWLLGYPAWAERFPSVHLFWLPADALPLPATTPAVEEPTTTETQP